MAASALPTSSKMAINPRWLEISVQFLQDIGNIHIYHLAKSQPNLLINDEVNTDIIHIC